MKRLVLALIVAVCILAGGSASAGPMKTAHAVRVPNWAVRTSHPIKAPRLMPLDELRRAVGRYVQGLDRQKEVSCGGRG